MYGKIQHRRVFFCWIIFFFLGWWVLFLCWLKCGGSLLFLLNSSYSSEQGMFVKTRILSSFRRTSVLKHQWEVKEESLDSGYSIGLSLPSSLKDWANLSVSLSVLSYNSTPLGFIPAPLPSNWRVNENARATSPPRPPWVIVLLRHCCYRLFKVSLEMPSIDPFLYASF